MPVRENDPDRVHPLLDLLDRLPRHRIKPHHALYLGKYHFRMISQMQR